MADHSLRAEKARLAARRFKSAAAMFRKLPEDGHIAIAGVRAVVALQDQVGRWLIQAWRDGLIPPTRTELIREIEHHSDEARNAEPLVVQARLVRCPSNLFNKVCGSAMVSGIFRGFDERGRIIFDDQKEYLSGLIPDIDPAHADQIQNERYAAACEWLADMLEHHEPVRRFGPVVVIDGHQLKLAEQTATILEHALIPGGWSFDEMRAEFKIPEETDNNLHKRVSTLRTELKKETKDLPFKIHVHVISKRVLALIRC